MNDKKTFILDTSVLIHDPTAFLNFEEHDIILPYIVIHEIDGLRKAPNGRGYSAREVIKQIDKLNQLSPDLSNVPLGENKGFLSVSLSAMPDNIDFTSDIQKSLRDDIIINCAIELKNKYPNIILVSKDIGQRVKASIKGVNAQDYLNSKVKNLENRYTGLHKEDVIIDAPKNGDIYNNILHAPDYLLHNEFCYVKFTNYENVPGVLCRNIEGILNPLPDYKRGVSNIKPIDDYQRMALDVLTDPKIPLVAISGTHGSGKAQPNDALVLTPNGYQKMGNLEIGEYVICGNGKKSKIIGIYPQGEKEIYNIVFSDGTSTECCIEHLWNVKTNNSEWTTLSLGEIKNNMNKESYIIPTNKIYDFENNTSNDLYITGKNLVDYYCIPEDKKIPKCYLLSSIENRIALLQGILDTIGIIEDNNLTIETIPEGLKNDIVFLVQTLGGLAIIENYSNKFKIIISLPFDILPFRDKKKIEKYYPKTNCRYIREITSAGYKECRCILIDDPEHTYMTNDCIITHNTLLSLAAAISQYENSEIETIMYVKPIIPVGGKDLGYLPGDKDEKLNSWAKPLFDNMKIIEMKNSKKYDDPEFCDKINIELEAYTYMRGRTFHNYFLILDENQNSTVLETRTALSRIGEKTKCVILADLTQIDNPYTDADSCGFTNAVEALKDHPLFAAVPLVHSQRSEISALVADRMNPQNV